MKVHFFAYGCPIAPTPFVETSFFIESPCTCVKNILDIFVCLFLNRLCVLPLICESSLSPIIHVLSILPSQEFWNRVL